MSIGGRASVLSGNDARRAEAAEQLDAMNRLISGTQQVAGLMGQLVNNILEVATYTIPTEGYVTREYGAAAGYVAVSPGQATRGYTVESAGPRGAAPTSGTGVFVMLPSTLVRTIPLASRTFTIYGTAGDTFSIVVGTAAPLPVLG